MCILLVFAPVGCGSSRATMTATNAVINTAIGVGAAAVNRSNGECFTWCSKGTRCNHETGLCDTLPCRGECKRGEQCIEGGLFPKCVPTTPAGLMLIDSAGTSVDEKSPNASEQPQAAE
jgi:hypothetical protein